MALEMMILVGMNQHNCHYHGISWDFLHRMQHPAIPATWNLFSDACELRTKIAIILGWVMMAARAPCWLMSSGQGGGDNSQQGCSIIIARGANNDNSLVP